jgi:hypothetical protein
MFINTKTNELTLELKYLTTTTKLILFKKTTTTTFTDN